MVALQAILDDPATLPAAKRKANRELLKLKLARSMEEDGEDEEASG